MLLLDASARWIRVLFYTIAALLLLGIVIYPFLPRDWRDPPLEPLHATPYVIVYGRQRCSLTVRMAEALDAERVPYRFKSVDDAAVADELHPRMREARLTTRRYTLPVVDVNGRLYVSPRPADVIKDYARP